MTADSCLEVQTALYGVLAGALAQDVFDHVPQGTDYPYVVIGDMRARAFDTQGFSGNDITAEIRAYSRGRGYAELKGILSAIRAALDGADFSLAGHVLVLCRHLDTVVSAEGDGETRQGVVRFRILTEPA